MQAMFMQPTVIDKDELERRAKSRLSATWEERVML